MADDVEDIGGISVSIGASHSKLVSDLAAAERTLDAWVASHKVVVPIGATFTAPQGVAARPAPVPVAVRPTTGDFGSGLAVQSRGQAAQQRAAARRGSVLEDPFYARQITAALAQTGEQLDKNNEIVAAGTRATRAQRTAFMEVQQVAAKPVALNIDTDTGAEDAQAKFGAAREAIGAPITVVVVTTEAQEQLGALGTFAQGVRAQIEKPIVTTVTRSKAPVADTAAIEKERATLAAVQKEAATATKVGVDFTDAQAAAQNLLNTVRELIAAATKLASMPAPKAAGAGGAGGGGKRPKGRPAAGGDEGDEEGAGYPRIQIVDQLERQRRASREGTGVGMLEIDRTEQARARQRERETSRSERQRQRDAEASRRLAANNDRQAGAQRLQALSAQEQAESQTRADPHSWFAPPLTQTRQAEIERERQAIEARNEARRARGGALPPNANQAPGYRAPGADRAQTRARAQAERDLQRALRADQARDEEVFAQAAPDKAVQREREIEERVARARAGITASGRTARTASSGLGALFGGTQGRLIEANARLAASDKAVNEAEKAALPFRKRIAEYDIDIATSSKDVVASRRESKKAFEADPKTVAALDKERRAILGQRDALAEVNKLQSGGNVLRNLAAISIGGAAFGIGMTVASFAVEQVVKGLGEFIEIQTGFGATSTRVTLALGQQTLALHGNVDAALAAAEAQAGLSASSSDALNTQLRLTTQIKAGALAQQQASELFRAGFGVGNAPSGLFGSFGGVGGTGLFGQKGFTQQVQTDIAAFTQGRGGNAFEGSLGNFTRGFDYAFNPAYRQGVNTIAGEKGEAKPGFDFSPEAINRFAHAIAGRPLPPPEPPPAEAFQQTAMTDELQAYLNNLNAAGRRGAEARGDTEVASYRPATSQTEVDQAVQSATVAGDVFGVTLAKVNGVVLAFGNKVVGAGEDAETAGQAWQNAAAQAAVGVGIADPAQLAKVSYAEEQWRQKVSAASLDTLRLRQAFEMPAIIGGIDRQRQFAANVQQPVQATLQAFANPNAPVGTGIAPEDQAKVADSLKEANDLQGQLNTQYEEGRQIIADTYRPAIVENFGAAAATAFDQALSAVETTGKRIAEISAGISNEQAAYQVAQYNFQLQIAKRSLSDIAGLTGANFGVEASRLGLLERQNLELSRQGQQLQFQMSQRQINFRVALAGFQAPGVTPEERQANVKAAQIEASFAQKQLDIQRKMFGNQVKIVDIGNLRQGRDLMRQIGLLQMGRQVQLDTAAAEQKLQRLNQLQQRNVQKVGTYLSAVDNVVGVAMGNIQQLEAAAGQAMTGLAKDVLAQFNIFIQGLTDAIEGATGGGGRPGSDAEEGHLAPGRVGGGGGGGGGASPGGGGTSGTAPVGSYAAGTVVPPNGSPHQLTAGEIAWELSHGIDLNGNGLLGLARGGVMGVGTPTRIGENGLVGEAADETLIVLSRPRTMSSGSSGGGMVVINFNGPIGVRSEDDIDAIARKVQQALGRTAATKGLRTL